MAKAKRKHQVQLAADLVVEETMQAGVHRVRRISPLENYYRRGWLGEKHDELIAARRYDAGCRFHESYVMGVCGVSNRDPTAEAVQNAHGAPWDRGTPFGQAKALEKYSRALRCLPVHSRALLISVVGNEISITDKCKGSGACVERCMADLKAALDLLVAHYGLFTR